MKIINAVGLVAGLCFACTTVVAEDLDQDLKWRARVDIGGTIPENPELSTFLFPFNGGDKMELTPGFQFDLGLSYRATPWLEVGPSIGFIFYGVDRFGDYYYVGDTTLFELPMMAEVTLEYPYAGRLVPYIGAGVGGVASFLTFGSDYYYEPDGSGSDLVLGFEAFAGVRYRFDNNMSLGIAYRFLATEDQNWDIDWWYGGRSRIGVESMRQHSVSLALAWSF